ncbi:MAG TPA: hypothetical protein DCZ95_19955 [Verrucomicrobia bacterium]|nr:MAG: hypothetical protein A2X46_17860 [Lentisphaerae bacterium GWF2_57_35]HBA86360.1 hypothetical protein [Verrucomicrobiota bacterium]
MNCPACKKGPLESSEHVELPKTLLCPYCQGQWIQASRYWSWVEQHGANLPEKPAPEQVWQPIDSHRILLCPECGALMMRFKVGHGVGFSIDHCSACGGIWFDRNELEALKDRNLHDDIHFIFSQAWQHQVQSQQNNALYQKRMEQLLGAEDFLEAKRIKGWLSQHPKRSIIQAYLTNK